MGRRVSPVRVMQMTSPFRSAGTGPARLRSARPTFRWRPESGGHRNPLSRRERAPAPSDRAGGDNPGIRHAGCHRFGHQHDRGICAGPGLEVTRVTEVTRPRAEFFPRLRAFEFVEEAAADQVLGGTGCDVAGSDASPIGVGPPAHSVPTLCPHPASDRPISSDPEWPLIWAYAPGLRSWEVSNPTATAPA